MKKIVTVRGMALCVFSFVFAVAEAAPLIQAHRGSRGEYDDNAAGGFARCLARGIRGYETDVRFTKDHALVIMHDRDVKRTTDGTGIVEEMAFDDVRRCRLQACSEVVPRAAYVFALFKGRTDTFIERNRVASSTPSIPFTFSRSSGVNPLSE